MEKSFDLLSFGELLLRLSPPNNERIVSCDTFNKQVGGAELNVVSGAALLGLRTGIITKLPDNDIGKYVKNRIRFGGVSDDYITYDDSKNSRLGIYYYEYGAHPRKPGIVYDRQNTSVNSINLDDYDDDMFKSARCFHTTGITLALGQKTRDAAIEMIKRFKANGALISFDVNFRLNLWSGEEARKCIEQILPYIDIFFCSEDTARLTFGKTGDVYEIMRSFCSEYPISIMCATQRVVHSPKIHTFGSVIYNSKEDKFYEEEPYRNIEVVDRIGSGDAYISGVLAGLLSSDLSCETALKYGNATGSVKNTIVGDLPSSDLKEIKRIIDEHNSTGPQTEMNR